MIYKGLNSVYTYTPLSVWSAMKRSKSFNMLQNDALDGMKSNGWDGGTYKLAATDISKEFDNYDELKKYVNRLAMYTHSKIKVNATPNEILIIDAKAMNMIFVDKDIKGRKDRVWATSRLFDADSAFYEVARKGYSSCCICENSIGVDDMFEIASAKNKNNSLFVEILCDNCAKYFDLDKITIGRWYRNHPKHCNTNEDFLIDILNTRKLTQG